MLNFNVLSPPLFIFLRRSHEASHHLHISSNVMCDEIERPNYPSSLWARGQGSLLPHPLRGSPPRPLCSAGPAAAPSPPAEPQITEGAERAVGFSCHHLLHGGHLTSKQEEHKESCNKLHRHYYFGMKPATGSEMLLSATCGGELVAVGCSYHCDTIMAMRENQTIFPRSSENPSGRKKSSLSELKAARGASGEGRSETKRI